MTEKIVDWDVKSQNKHKTGLHICRNFARGDPRLTEDKYGTVKTLYNVTRYNRIFNIRHKIAGNGSVSIKIPSL